MDLRKLISQIRFVGLGPALQTMRSTLERGWLDKRQLKTQPCNPLSNPYDISSAKSLPSGGSFWFACVNDKVDLEVHFLAPDLVRITWRTASTPVPYAIARQDWAVVDLDREVNASEYSLVSSALRVTIMPDGGIRFTDRGGNLVREELPPEFNGERFIHRALLDPDAHIYGLGERAAPLNLRGGSYRMWNSDQRGGYGPGKDPIYTCIPVYLELHDSGSYLAFYENYYPATFSFTETIEAAFEGGTLRYYIAAGKPDRLLQLYTELTGRAPLPPRWALGYHQSRWGYRNEADIRSLIEGFHKNNLPVSAVHLDIDYMQGFRVFTINEKNFPDMAALSHDLEGQGIKMVAILDPGVKVDRRYFMYQEGVKENMFCTRPNGKTMVGLVWPGRAAFPDFTDPKARLWWGEQYQRLLQAGIAGFWHDMNEPVSFSAWGEMRLPLSTRHCMEGRQGDHRQGHNIYGLLMARSGYEGLRRLRAETRPWIVTRSGWAGFQRYAWNWTGDVNTSWEALSQTVRTVLNLGVSGQPYSGGDIGGFNGNPSAELYTRWFQVSAFFPFFRTHSAKDLERREPWSFGEQTTSIIRAYLMLRYQLIPLFYSLAYETSQTGAAIIRPLFWEFPQERRLWDVGDAFLVGSSLLVAPILKEGAQKRSIALPPGGWYSFWDDTLYSGDQGEFEVPVSLENIPLFVREGSLLPLLENDILNLHFYPPVKVGPAQEHVALSLYSDAGDGYPSGPEDWRVDRFSVHSMQSETVIRRENEGAYPFPYSQIRFHFHGEKPKSVQIDQIETPVHDNQVQTPLFHEITVPRT